MNQVSNEVGGIIHAGMTLILSYLISTLFFALGGRLIVGLFVSILPMFGAIVSTIISLVILFISVHISAYVMRTKFSYSDKVRVVNVATFVSIVIAILSSFGGLLMFFSIVSLINLVVGMFIFYSVSRAAL
ncbi:MAG: hypothetical protein KBC22_02795 [Candidatus Pacebacteria bacterium]|nr:hypothetical protein [Candidatus Paceibacterota bacterium]